MSDDDKTSPLPEFSVVSPSEPPQADVVKKPEEEEEKEEQQVLPQDSHGNDDTATPAVAAATSATVSDEGEQDSKISHGDAKVDGEPPAVASNAGEPGEEPAAATPTAIADEEVHDSKISHGDATAALAADGEPHAVTSNAGELADEPDPDASNAGKEADEPDPDADDATATEPPSDTDQQVKQHPIDGDTAAEEVSQPQKEEYVAVPADEEPVAASALPSQPHADTDATPESPKAPEEAGNPNLVVGTVTEDISAEDNSAPQTEKAANAVSVVPVESATAAETTTEKLPDAALTTTDTHPDAAAAPTTSESQSDATPSTETQPIAPLTEGISAPQAEAEGNAASAVPSESASAAQSTAEAQPEAAPTTTETHLDAAPAPTPTERQPDADLEEAPVVQEPPVPAEHHASEDGHEETLSRVSTNDESPGEGPQTADEVIPTTNEKTLKEVLLDGSKDDAADEPPASNGSQLEASPEADTGDSVPAEETPVVQTSEQEPSEVSSHTDATEEISPPQGEENTVTHTEESAPKQPADEDKTSSGEGKVIGDPPQSELAVDESKYDELNGSVKDESATGGELANQASREVSLNQIANEQPVPVESLVAETVRELPDLDEIKISQPVLEVPNGPVENGEQQESKEELSRSFPVDSTEPSTEDAEHLKNKSQESQTLDDAKQQQRPVSGLKLPLIFAGVAIATAGIVLASVTKSH